MYCRKCGEKIDDEAQFCPACGAQIEKTVSGEKAENQQVKKKGKRRIWVLLGVLLVIAACLVLALFIAKQRKEKLFDSNLAAGNKYLEDMDYEKAEDSFLKAIKIAPKKKEPYMKLTDIYREQDNPQKAIAILKKAEKHVNTKKEENQDVVQRYNLYTYVDEVLIPDEGQCKEGEYTCNYINTEHFLTVDSIHSEKGVMNWTIKDFDDNGKEELLVLMLKNQEKAFDADEVERNAVYLQMYANVDGEVKLEDEYVGLCPVLGFGDKEDDGIFLKKTDGKIYICGSNAAYTHMYSDGLTYRSFIVSYDEGKFVEEGGDTQIKEIYDFMNNEDIRNPMIQKLNEIDLKKEANRIKKDDRPYFTFIDDVDKTLLRIAGSTDGKLPSFYEKTNTDLLGEIKLEVKFGKLENFNDSNETVAKGDRGYHFEYVCKSFLLVQSQMIITHMQSEQEKLGVTANITGPNYASDIADQVSMLNVAINRMPDGIAVTADDYTTIADSLEQAAEYNIPVISVGSEVSESMKGLVKATVAPDNRSVGENAAKHLYDAMKNHIADTPIRIGVISSEGRSDDNKKRGIGFTESIIELAQAGGYTVTVTGNAKYLNEIQGNQNISNANIIVEIRQPKESSEEQCESEAMNIMNKSDTVAIYGTDQISTESILQADSDLNKLGRNKDSIIAVGSDADDTIVDGIKEGKLLGVVAVSTKELGENLIKTLVKICDGEEGDDVLVSSCWCDKSNIAYVRKDDYLCE